MEGKNHNQVGSSSSFTSELFGSNNSSSSPGIFGSIFAPPSKVLGRGSLRPEVVGKKQDSSNESYNAKPEAPVSEASNKNNEGEGEHTPSKDASSFFQEPVQPCHLSSSIYYGGQDIYHHSPNSQSSNMTSTFKKDGTEDDSGSASRGNWWQGALLLLAKSLYIQLYHSPNSLSHDFILQALSITKSSPAAININQVHR